MCLLWGGTQADHGYCQISIADGQKCHFFAPFRSELPQQDLARASPIGSVTVTFFSLYLVTKKMLKKLGDC